ALLDRYAPGQRVKVGFDLRGGEHNGRYYVNLQAWRIHPADEAGSPPPSSASDSGGGSPGGDRPYRERDSGPPRQDRRDRGDRDRGDRDRDRDRGGRDRDDRRGSRNFGGGRRGAGDEDDIDF